MSTLAKLEWLERRYGRPMVIDFASLNGRGRDMERTTSARAKAARVPAKGQAVPSGPDTPRVARTWKNLISASAVAQVEGGVFRRELASLGLPNGGGGTVWEHFTGGAPQTLLWGCSLGTPEAMPRLT
jgi:hypothetical protein